MWLGLGLAACEREAIEDCKGRRDAVGAPITDPLRLPDSLVVLLCIHEALSEPVAEGLGLAAMLCAPESDCVGVPDPLGVTAVLGVNDSVALSVASSDGVPVSEPVYDCEGPPLRHCLCACERVAAPDRLRRRARPRSALQRAATHCSCASHSASARGWASPRSLRCTCPT